MERRRRAATTAAEQAEPLIDFITRISPRYHRPTHLQRLLSVLERTEREPVRAIVNLPPRHSKTESLLHGIARRIKRRPWETVAYVTYGDSLARDKSILCREYALRAGVQLRDDSAAANRWRTPQLGGALFTSIGGAITGQGANVLVIDDPHKDRTEAESQVERDKVWNWYIGTGLDRVEPGGSVIVCQTRWHPDDLTGRLVDQRLQQDGWEVISLPALGLDQPDGSRVADENGEPLWPEQWPREELLKKRIDEYEWRSKFQQAPVKRGGAVFRDVRYYDPRTLPNGLRISVGMDLAYSKKTHADWSACVVLGQDMDGTTYVLAVAREQMEVPAFAEVVRGTVAQWPTARVWWHTSTTEAGTAQLLRSMGLNVKNELARADKFVRAQPVAAQWNAGRLLLPGGFTDEYGNARPAPAWVDEFVREVTRFTGIGDKRDDQVDALASAYSAWCKAPSQRHDEQG